MKLKNYFFIIVSIFLLQISGSKTVMTAQAQAFRTGSNANFDKSVFHNTNDTCVGNRMTGASSQNLKTYGQRTLINGISVPSDFPLFESSILEESVGPGRLFLTTWNGPPYYILILENDGTPYFYRRVRGNAWEFKLLPNGQLVTRMTSGSWGYGLMDSTYNVVSVLDPANGYGLNGHDIYMTEDEHYFLIVTGFRTVDMSQIIPGGHPEATVIDNHIQEFDENGNLVFEWLSNEHLNVEDSHGDLTLDRIDYVHMNSVAVDYDGHIIASCRRQDTVIKIDRQTGEIIWFLGGVNNDFEFVNDEYGISRQHHARPVPGQPDQYTIFDNFNDISPRFSRGVEYHLDSESMQATLVWEYRHTPDLYAPRMGSLQRLSNGNSLLNFVEGSLPKAVEVTPDGDVVYEADFVDYALVYRTFRFEWDSPADRPYLIVEPFPEKVSLIFNKFGDRNVDHYVIYVGLDESALEPVATTFDPFFDLFELQSETTYFFAVTSVDEVGNESEFSNIEEALVRFVSPGENYIYNGDFSNGTAHWELNLEDDAAATGSVNDDGRYELNIENGGNDVEHIQLIQRHIPLIQGRTYLLEFDVQAVADRLLNVRLERNQSPWDNYSQTGYTDVSSQVQHKVFEFEMNHFCDFDARLVFSCGDSDIDLFFDNISVIEVANSIEDNSTTSALFELCPNYPNPFNPNTTIRYRVTEPARIRIAVYNIAGQRVAELTDKQHRAGLHTINFNAADLSSGVYFYTLNATSLNNEPLFYDVKKMALIK